MASKVLAFMLVSGSPSLAKCSRLAPCEAGLLSAPRAGAGLALTLSAEPSLDGTHRVLGRGTQKRGLKEACEALEQER